MNLPFSSDTVALSWSLQRRLWSGTALDSAGSIPVGRATTRGAAV